MSTAPKRILVADDNAVMRTIVSKLIKIKPGYEVCGEAVDGVDLVQQAKELKPDLVLLDFRMPRLDGIEAATIIKKILPQVRIVMFKMYDHIVSRTMRTAANIDAIVSKSDGINKLLESIEI